MSRLAIAAALVVVGMRAAYAAQIKDRACTAADIRRFEAMMGGIKTGATRTDPRFQISIRYLGTKIVAGICHVQIRPAD